jgi:hypothetical protein
MSLKVIGAGLGRTGTMSLKFALEHIGFGPCYHMVEFFAHLPEHLPLWLDAADGRPDWDAMFDGYVSTVDYPGCTYWRALVAKWPEAKVILTTRDPDSWFESANSTVLSPKAGAMLANSPAKRFFETTVHHDFGDRSGDREFMTAYFRRWNDAVMAEVPPEKLLVFKASDGWEPLCEFLDVPVPPEPYPRVNSREDMQMMSENIRRGQAESPTPGAMTTAPTDEQMAQMGRMRIAAMREQAFPKA